MIVNHILPPLSTHELLPEYWRHKTMLEMAAAFRTPIYVLWINPCGPWS